MALDIPLLWAAAASLVAGVTRGFSGFGGALIFVPLVSAAYGPHVAAPVLLIVDALLTMPMLLRAVRVCIWREVLPLALGAMLTVPAGALLLDLADPLLLRWSIVVLALALLALIASGWRYAGKPGLGTTFGLGMVAGVFGGAAQMSGPPVVAFWMGSGAPAPLIRANLIAFFAVATVASALSYAGRGLFTVEVGWLSLALGPLYAAGLIAGSRAFAGASDTAYRKAAYVVILLAALLSLPLLDGWLRP